MSEHDGIESGFGLSNRYAVEPVKSNSVFGLSRNNFAFHGLKSGLGERGKLLLHEDSERTRKQTKRTQKNCWLFTHSIWVRASSLT